MRQDRAYKTDRLAVIVCDQLHHIAIDPNVPGYLIKRIADIIFCRPDLRSCWVVSSAPILSYTLFTAL